MIPKHATGRSSLASLSVPIQFKPDRLLLTVAWMQLKMKDYCEGRYAIVFDLTLSVLTQAIPWDATQQIIVLLESC